MKIETLNKDIEMMKNAPPSFNVKMIVNPFVATKEGDCIVFLNSQEQYDFLAESMNKAGFKKVQP